MVIKPSSSLRNNYTAIAAIAKETQEPIYITVNGEGDGVFMNLEAYERREQMLDLRAKVLQAEWERLSGARTMTIEEVREALNE